MTKLHEIRTTLRIALLLLLVFVLSWPANLRVASAADNHANMSESRQLLRAVTMTDGKVMVIGGNNGIIHLASTIVYDPTLNVWTPRASMATPRFSHAAVTLQNGRVMAIGGNNFDTGVMNSVEIYDPVTNTWSAAAPMSVKRASHVAAILPDGRVLVAGGGNDDGDLSSTEIYDPATNTWIAGPSLPATRKETGAALLGDGRVLLAGGVIGGTMSSSAIVYDAATNSWSSVASLPTQRYIHAMTSLEDGRVSVSGGFDPNYSPLKSTVIYDPDTNSWSSGPLLNNGILGHDAVLLQSGKVFVVGGAGNSGPSNRSESHHPTPITPVPKPSVAAGAVSSGTNVTLSTYISGLTIHYTTDGSTPTTASPVYSATIAVNEPMTIKAIAHHSSWGSSQVMTVSYTMQHASTPTAVPASGEVARGTLVELSSGTSDATIHYTTDGSTPSAASPVYEAPIAINSAMTIKAIAVKSGVANSLVMSEAYTLELTKPDAPVISGVTAGDGSVEVAFTLAFDGGSAVTEYSVTSSGGQTATGSSSPITVTGLTNGTAYTFTVTATNAVGDSAASAASAAVTPATVPQAPTNATATGGNGQATITFTAPSDNGGSAITQYTVTSSGGQTATGSSSPITVTGLTNGTAYTFTVTATNAVGDSAASTASAAVTPATLPGAPVLHTATAGDRQIRLSWSPVVGSTGYKVFKSTTPGGYGSEEASVTGSVYSYDVMGLTNGTTYYFVIQATNPGGDSTSSNEVSATPRTVPSAPTGITAVAGDGQAAVSFTTPANGGSDITYYEVTAMPGNITVTGAGSPITVTGLSNGVTYTFTVQAVNSAGRSVASDASNAVTPGSTNTSTPSTQSTPSTPSIPSTPTTTPDPEQTPVSTQPTADVFNSRVVNEANLVKTIESKVAEAREANATIDFADTRGHWAENTIDIFVKLNLINGYTDGTFRPNSPITRAEFAAILNGAFNIQAGNNTNVILKDIGDHWAKEAVENLVTAGVINGYKDGMFKPDNTITREEMVIMLSRIVDLNNVAKDTTKGNFNDLNGAYATEEIKAAAQVGIVSGKGNGRFDPKNNATRAEALQIILNVLKLNPQLKTLLDSLS